MRSLRNSSIRFVGASSGTSTWPTVRLRRTTTTTAYQHFGNLQQGASCGLSLLLSLFPFFLPSFFLSQAQRSENHHHHAAAAVSYTRVCVCLYVFQRCSSVIRKKEEERDDGRTLTQCVCSLVKAELYQKEREPAAERPVSQSAGHVPILCFKVPSLVRYLRIRIKFSYTVYNCLTTLSLPHCTYYSRDPPPPLG